MNVSGAFMALDVGARRIGVAVADPVAKIANPLVTLEHNDQIFQQLQELVEKEQVATLIVGLPRGLEGQETDQTSTVREFARGLEQALHISPIFQDEALSSVIAEKKLRQSKKSYKKEDVDMYAATGILQDYLNAQLIIKEPAS